jgi:hypothetical protein
MSQANLHDVGNSCPAERWDAVTAPLGPYDPRDPWLRRMDAAGAATFPAAGQLGHGCTAVLRSQPARLVDGRVEGGYTGAFEIICLDCGDNPNLDYSGISSRLQKIRGPYAMAAGLAAYKNHLGIGRSTLE